MDLDKKRTFMGIEVVQSPKSHLLPAPLYTTPSVELLKINGFFRTLSLLSVSTPKNLPVLSCIHAWMVK